MGMAASRSTLDTNGMAASRSILDTNGDGATPVDTPLDTNGNGSTSVDTRHKWGWCHPGRHSTQMVIVVSLLILYSDSQSCRYSTQMVRLHTGRYSTQMARTVSQSMLYSNGESCTYVDTLHKWRGLYPMSILYTNGTGCTSGDTRHNLRYSPSQMDIYKLDWTNTINNMYVWCSAKRVLCYCVLRMPFCLHVNAYVQQLEMNNRLLWLGCVPGVFCFSQLINHNLFFLITHKSSDPLYPLYFKWVFGMTIAEMQLTSHQTILYHLIQETKYPIKLKLSIKAKYLVFSLPIQCCACIEHFRGVTNETVCTFHYHKEASLVEYVLYKNRYIYILILLLNWSINFWY
jgi:hypothetical protein